MTVRKSFFIPVMAILVLLVVVVHAYPQTLNKVTDSFNELLSDPLERLFSRLSSGMTNYDVTIMMAEFRMSTSHCCYTQYYMTSLVVHDEVFDYGEQTGVAELYLEFKNEKLLCARYLLSIPGLPDKQKHLKTCE